MLGGCQWGFVWYSTMVFFHSHVKMVLSILLSVLYPLSDNLLGFLDKLTVQVNGVAVYAANCIVLTEDVVGGLLVVVVGLCCKLL